MVTIREFSKKFVAVVALAAVVSLAGTAQAATINVDFGPSGSDLYSGTAAAPDSGTTWNLVSNLTGETGALSDSQNGASSVTLTMSGVGNSISLSPTPSVPWPTGYVDLLRDQFYIGGNNTATILINNLNPTSTYTLYAYEVRGTNNENTTFTVTSNSGAQSLTSGLDLLGTTTLTATEDYVVFSNLVPKLNGIIYQLQLDFTGFAENTQFGAINGLQLVESVPAPEPTASLLLLGGIGGILTLRRRFGERSVSNAS